jgi:hypothetical protein
MIRLVLLIALLAPAPALAQSSVVAAREKDAILDIRLDQPSMWMFMNVGWYTLGFHHIRAPRTGR